MKRVFAKPGKGKAAMYLSGTSGPSDSTSATPDASAKTAGGANGSYNWHRGGNITKRFDGKEEPPHAAKPAPSSAPAPAPEVRGYDSRVRDDRDLMMPIQVKIGNNIAKEDELKAMAAMFQQQTANWEETQEKMSQLVSRSALLVIRSIPISNEHSYSFVSSQLQSAADLHQPSRWWPQSWWEAILASLRPPTAAQLCLLSVRPERFAPYFSTFDYS